MRDKVTHKAEAFAGLNAVLGVLNALEPGKALSELDIAQMKTAVNHAHKHVVLIQEVQRVRKPKQDTQ